MAGGAVLGDVLQRRRHRPQGHQGHLQRGGRGQGGADREPALPRDPGDAGETQAEEEVIKCQVWMPCIDFSDNRYI